MNDLAVTILLCYSDKDRDMVDDLKAHLRPLEYCKRIILWDHSNITPGADRKQEMDKHLAETHSKLSGSTKLQCVFPQNHSRQLQRSFAGDLAIIHHAGKSECQRLTRRRV